jgi:hypothetical protein
MKRFGWQDLVWALGVAAAAVAAFYVFRTPEPARTGLELVRVLCGSAEERRALLERHVVEPLEVRALDPSEELEAEREYSREELSRELTTLNAVWPSCTFSLRDWTVRAHTKGAQWLEGTLEYSASEASDLHRQRREVRALFREAEGQQRLERVILGELERSLPEARP